MVAKFYTGSPYEHPQENEAFRYLCSAAAERIGDREDVRVIGNVNKIDALVLRNRSITIVDFKDYGGHIGISEDFKWHTSEGKEVLGGSYPNPYRQVKRYKERLINWLAANHLLPEESDLGHISGLVMFTQPVRINSTAMSPKANKWFRATNFKDGIDFLRDRSSPKLTLSSKCMDAIVDKLSLEPFMLKRSESFVPESALRGAVLRAEFAVFDLLEEERMIKQELEDREWIQRQCNEISERDEVEFLRALKSNQRKDKINVKDESWRVVPFSFQKKSGRP
jgi:hypothetical protein